MTARTTRRSYGTGALFEKTDRAGRVSWAGKWRHDGTQVKRTLGPKRTEGSRDGLTRRQAEAELRRLIHEVRPTVPASEALTIGEVGRRYMNDLDRRGRKKSTPMSVDTALRAHLEPYFGERAVSSITYEDVADLVALMRRKGLAPKTMHNYIGTLSTLYTFAMHPRRRWATVNPCTGIELD